jgi:1-acyl-sn-glycerol-3-phosphate acyltransferase
MVLLTDFYCKSNYFAAIIEEMLYKVIQVLLKLYLPLFFKSVEVRGLDKVPVNKPVIFAVNHQNAFLDAILVGIYVKRPVYFLTRSDLFQGKWVLKIFNALNLVPIFRQKDGDKYFKEKNEETFKYCIEQLEKGKPVLIFPEGKSEPLHHLFKLKKGVARLAMEAEAKHNFNLRLHIVPVSINYMNHFLPGKNVFVEYLDPIIVSKYKNIFSESPYKAITTLLGDVSTSLKGNVLHIDGNYVRFKRKYWKGIIRHSKNDKEMLAGLISIPVKDKVFSKKGFNWKKEKRKYERRNSPFIRIYALIISLPGILLFLPTILITKLLLLKVKDESFYLSVLCISWLVFGLIQSIVLAVYLWTLLDWDFYCLAILLNFVFVIVSLRNMNRIV